MTELQTPAQVNPAEFNLRSGSFQLALRFDPEALATLGREIGVGYVSLPRRAAEVGGLLTGEIVRNDSDWIVTIRDVTPVQIQYEYGPSYRLSAADKEAFCYLTDNEVFRYLAEDHDSGARRIGWYRSNTRPGHQPEEHDREISRTFFESDQKIFLFCDVSPDSQIHASCIVIGPNEEEVAFPFELGRFTGLEEFRSSGRESSTARIADAPVEAVTLPPQLTELEEPGNSRGEEAAGPVVADAEHFEALMASLPAGAQVEPAALPPRFAALESVWKSPPGNAAGPVVSRVERTEERLISPQSSMGAVSAGETPRYFTGANLRFAAAVVAAGAIAYYARGRVATTAPPPEFARASSESPVVIVPAAASNADDSLGLRAEYQGNSLLLGWDRTSARVTAATSGVFIIADGSKTRVLTLSPRELRNGGILYKPAADDINIELQIIEPRGRTASQSIRVVGAPAPSSETAPIGQIARRVLRQPPVPRKAARALTVERFEEPPAPSLLTEQRPVTTVDAPLINQEAKMIPPWFASTLMPPPPQPAPVQPAPFKPAGQLRPAITPAPTRSDNDADPAAGAAPAFHAAIAIHAPQPRVPQGVYVPQYAFDHPFEVKVEITINTAGRVTEARLVDTSGPYATQLGPSALSTARGWDFHPATLAGKPVVSTMVLTFRYSRPR